MAHGHKTGGRRKGTPNRITTAFKDAVRIVYDDIGGNTAFAAWARENPTEFYKIAARLIPSEVSVQADHSVTVIVDRWGAMRQVGEAHVARTLSTPSGDGPLPMLMNGCDD